MMSLNLFNPQSKTVSYVNALVNIMVFNKSSILRERYVRSMLQNRLVAFVQLAAIRCRALRFEMWLVDRLDIEVEEFMQWEYAGYDWVVPVMVRNAPSHSKSRSPVPLDERKLPVSRVRKMDHASDQLLQQRQLFLPSPRHLPSAEEPPSPVMALLPAPVLTIPRKDPTRENPSKLRAMVQAQEDERLTKMHDDLEEFRRTGKQPARESIDGGPPTKRYRPSETSGYRPYSVSSTLARAQAGTEPILNSSPGFGIPPAKRLGSTELFPDRYQAQEDTLASDVVPTEARGSVGEGTNIVTRDFAYPGDNTATLHEDSEQKRASAPPEAKSSSASASSRRSAARSDSSLSSVSSTESSRARKALACKLSQDKSRVELNSGKSTASVGFASNAPSLFRNFVNAMSPSSSKTSAEDVTRKLNKSPTRREGRIDRESGSESSLDGASEGERLTRSSSKRSRETTVAGSSSSKRQQKRRSGMDGFAQEILLFEGTESSSWSIERR